MLVPSHCYSYSVLPDVVINTMTKCNLRRKEFIWLILPGHNPSLMKARTELQTPTKQKPLRKLLTGTLPLSCSVSFLLNPGLHASGDGDVHTQINHQSRQFPPYMSAGQTDVSHPFVDSLSSQVTWVCIKRTIKMTSTQVQYSLWPQKSSFFASV